MQTKTKRILLSASLAFCCSVAGWAQDVMVDFLAEGTNDGNKFSLPKEDIIIDYVGLENHGLQILSYQSCTITCSGHKIEVIEMIGAPKDGKTDNVTVSTGSFRKNSNGTYIWEGAANKIEINGVDLSTNLRISRLRLWYDKAEYNPDAPWDNPGGGSGGGTGSSFDVDLSHDNTDYSQLDRVYAPVNVLPKDGHGVPMAVVSAPGFKQTLQPYLEWKTQQGYEVQELYTDQIGGAKQGRDLCLAIRQRLMEMDPRPAYVLLVGDTEAIPAFEDEGRKTSHVTDFYYGEFTDDHFADAYVGRFSATSTSELQAQLDKTKHMATLQPADGGWLTQSLTIDDVATNIKEMKPSAEFSLAYPLSFQGNKTSRSSSSLQNAINTYINGGCSFVNYFGHGMRTYWSGGYDYNNVALLSNKDKYPVVTSVTCYTGSYEYYCLAEAFMRKKDAGAVAVIAASQESYADTNDKFFSGHKGSGDIVPRIGFFRSLFPTVGDDPSQRSRTIGQAMNVGTFAMLRYNEPNFMWDNTLYNLFGDPTYQPYITTPKANSLSASSYNIKTGRKITVSSVPDAMVCLSKGRTVVAAAVTDATGKATLLVPASAPTGEATLYTSAPGYSDLSRKVSICAGDGTEEMMEETLSNVTCYDVLSRATVGNVVNDSWQGAGTVSGTASNAKYQLLASSEFDEKQKLSLQPWLDTTSPSKSIFIRNQYPLCGIVTTQSGGKARSVTAEWLHPTGKTEVIGVYGSKYPYSSPSDAWNGNEGTFIGTLSNSGASTLYIKEDYPYLLFRAENFKKESKEQSNAFLLSLTIGWEATLPQCATPKIAFEGGKFSFNCSTKGATYNYGVTPAQTAGKFVLTVTAEADGYKASAPATLAIDASELAKLSGDVDENGSISIADVVKLINSLNPKK